MKVKLRATVILQMEYDADSNNYGDCDFVDDMIDIDKRNFDDDPMIFIENMLENGETKILIKKITS